MDEKSPQLFMHDGMLAAGWERYPHGHPRRYTTQGGSSYLTWEKDGVRVATSGGLIYTDRGTVMLDDGAPTDVTIQALLVDPDKRRQGRAGRGLGEIAALADEAGITLYIQPAEIEKGSPSVKVLRDFYQRFGFVATDDWGKVLVRQPGGHVECEASVPDGGVGERFVWRYETGKTAVTVCWDCSVSSGATRLSLSKYFDGKFVDRRPLAGGSVSIDAAKLAAVLWAHGEERLYHATAAENLSRIMAEGLQPRIGENSAAIDERVPGVYLFTSKEALDTALSGWFGELFADDEAIAVLAVDASCIVCSLTEGAEYEAVCTDPIPPSAFSLLYIDEGEPLSGDRQKNGSGYG